MQNTINRNLLKYAVQRAITCPRCQQILDMRKVVLITLTTPAHSKEPNVVVPKPDTDLSWLPEGGQGIDRRLARMPQATRTYTLCTACWYNVKLAMFDIAREAQGTLEVLDAREVFPPSLSEAKRLLKAIGITLKYDKDLNEYSVNLAQGTEATCYYTNDLLDAIGTGRMMAAKGAK